MPSNLLMFCDVFKYTLRTNMKMKPITMTGIKKYGFTAAATIIVPIMLKMTWVASSIAFGKKSSVALKINLWNYFILKHIESCDLSFFA